MAQWSLDGDPDDAVYFCAVVHPPPTAERGPDNFSLEQLHTIAKFLPGTPITNQHIEGPTDGEVVHSWVGIDNGLRAVGKVSGKGGLMQELARTCLHRKVFDGASLNHLIAWNPSENVSNPVGLPVEVAIMPLSGAYRGPECKVESVIAKNDLLRYVNAEKRGGIYVRGKPTEPQSPDEVLAELLWTLREKRMAETTSQQTAQQQQTPTSTAQPAQAQPQQQIPGTPAPTGTAPTDAQKTEAILKLMAVAKAQQAEIEKLRQQVNAANGEPGDRRAAMKKMLESTGEVLTKHLESSLQNMGPRGGNAKLVSQNLELIRQFLSERDQVKKEKILDDVMANEDNIIMAQACSASAMALTKSLQETQLAKEAAVKEAAALKAQLEGNQAQIVSAAMNLFGGFGNSTVPQINDRIRSHETSFGTSETATASQPPLKAARVVPQTPAPQPAQQQAAPQIALQKMLAELDEMYKPRVTSPEQPLPTDVAYV